MAGLEHDLLLRAIVASPAEAAAAYHAWRPHVDFEGPIDEETTALLPQLHAALARLQIDDPLAGVFKGIARRAWYENQTLLASVEPALAALVHRQIDVTVIGEVPLVLSCYGSLYLRRIGQVDILVTSQQAREAAELIIEAGWRAGPLAQEEVTYRHVRRFAGTGDRTLALHWHFIGSAASNAADRHFQVQSEPWTLQGVATRQLAPAAMLLHLLLSDLPAPGPKPALWVADIRSALAYAGDQVNWRAIVDFAIAESLAARLQQRLLLLGVYGIVPPAAEMHRLASARTSLPEVIDRFLLRRQLRGAKLTPARGWNVFADYLRSDRRAGVASGLAEFPHFVRHRWGLGGRRQILPAIARHLWRRT